MAWSQPVVGTSIVSHNGRSRWWLSGDLVIDLLFALARANNQDRAETVEDVQCIVDLSLHR